MRAYYFDNHQGDQRLPHDSGKSVSDAVLASIGVFHQHIPIPVPATGDYPEIDALANKRGYKNRDVINITREGLGDQYETKIKTFFEEHMHEDEEIRYILDGSGFFDIREHPSDKWIRCAIDAGDLMVLPAGIYHRFTLDEKNSIKTMRLFKDEPKWTPYNRDASTDINRHRVEYVRSIVVS